MRKVTVEEVKGYMRMCGNNPNKYTQKELEAIASKYVKLTPAEMEEWDLKYKDYD